MTDIKKSHSSVKFELLGEEATVALGGQIADAIANIKAPLLITLTGDLGAGKTTLSRGILQRLGHVGAVKSPTYTLIEPYELPLGAVYHCDLYRLADAEELEYMGFADYLTHAALCLVEWPEKGEGFLPRPSVAVQISSSQRGRCVTLEANSAEGIHLIGQLKGL